MSLLELLQIKQVLIDRSAVSYKELTQRDEEISQLKNVINENKDEGRELRARISMNSNETRQLEERLFQTLELAETLTH